MWYKWYVQDEKIINSANKSPLEVSKKDFDEVVNKFQSKQTNKQSMQKDNTGG